MSDKKNNPDSLGEQELLGSFYEAPKNPDFEVVTDGKSIGHSVDSILKFLNQKLKFNL